MATQAQIEANRRNAQKSTGPRSDPGKAAASQNALRHGLCQSTNLLDKERTSDFEELIGLLRDEHQPFGATEEILVFKMAEHFFNMKRASYLIAVCFDELDSGHMECLKETALYHRYHGAADRGFNQNLNLLRKLQKDRKLEEIGFVSQEAEPAPAASPQVTPIPPPSAPVQAHPAPIATADATQTTGTVADRSIPAPHKAA